MILKVCLLLSTLAVARAHVVVSAQIKIQLARYSMRNPATYMDAIVPGTKWCGDGDIAENYEDLGIFNKTDMCCRDHDYCDDTIPSGGSHHGLTNSGRYTRLHCKCDYAFFECLKTANKMVSNIVGVGYFNALGGQCYDKTPPATCVKYESIVGLRKRCVEYTFDESKPDEWQWFDVPRYLVID